MERGAEAICAQKLFQKSWKIQHNKFIFGWTFSMSIMQSSAYNIYCLFYVGGVRENFGHTTRDATLVCTEPYKMNEPNNIFLFQNLIFYQRQYTVMLNEYKP